MWFHNSGREIASTPLNMALVTISGYPCSGKTTRALQIQSAFEETIRDPAYDGPIKNVKLISDDTLELSRKGYDGKL